MKKLISVLMLLMMVLTASVALGEEVVTDAAPAAETSLLAQGLVVTVVGLAGVFLVLILFFLTIKMMHKMLK